MLSITGDSRVYFYATGVDMHTSFNGLCELISSAFEADIISGSYFVFLNRRRNLMKVLYWDIDGLAIWYKRLERGTFSRKSNKDQLISRREFFMLLEGVEAKRINLRYSAA